MSETTRKTFRYKLMPTPHQEQALDEVVWRCRLLYNAALEQRIFCYRQRGVSHTRYNQEAELKDLRAGMPEYAAIHSHVLQDVLARLDKTYQAFFRRVKQGEKPGFPRFKGRNRYHSFTYKEYGNGGHAGQWLSGPLQDRAHRRALVAPTRRHAQDRDGRQGS
jgi:putative transposase